MQLAKAPLGLQVPGIDAQDHLVGGQRGQELSASGMLSGAPDQRVELLVRLAEAARGRPPGSGKVRLLIVERFAHVDPKESAGGWGDLWEAARLLGFISEILTAMEGG